MSAVLKVENLSVSFSQDGRQVPAVRGVSFEIGRGETVALVDSDSPTVPVPPIARGLAALEGPGRALVGPCDDGGYYLIALGAVSPRGLGILSGVPWSTGRVMEVTRARCASLGLALEELPTWYDVDDADDLARLRTELEQDPARAPRTSGWLRDHHHGVSACASR